MSLALARKYRPKSFDDLIGQESVAQTLSHALDTKRLSHAYLFSGLRGSGKTSTARIFAKALLCEQGESAKPCETCTHCVMANENRHMDIIEMDAASNRGIDDIKELIEHTKYKPASARYKIFIIDEVHMLTPQAFNALLKTLEEPPDFVKFILATTDPLKLPATILSRTQHFRFKKIPQPLIQSHLEHILNLESIDFEKDAVSIIARSGAGSLRDSLTLLDQAIVYANGYLDVGTVTSMLGIIDPMKIQKLFESLNRKDTEGVLSFLNEAEAFEGEMILDEMTLYLKSMLLEKQSLLTPLIIERYFRIIADAKQLMAIGSDNDFVLALTLFKMIEAQQIKTIDAMLKQLENELQTDLPPKAAALSDNTVIADEPEVITITQDEIDALEPARSYTLDARPTDTPQTASDRTSETDEDIQARYRRKFETLKSKIYDRNYELGDIFERHITFVSYENGTLRWESTAQGEAREMLKQTWGIIRTLVQDIFGETTKIDNIAKKKADRPNEDANQPSADSETLPKPEHNDADSASIIEEVEMKSSCIAPDAGETEAAKEKDPSELLDEPMIKAALEMLSPKKVRIKRNT